MDITAIITAIIASGILNVIITAIIERRKHKADANLIGEQVESADIGNLKAIIQTWQDQYASLVQRMNATEADLDQMREQNLQLIDRLRDTESGAMLAISNLRNELEGERTQRRRQTGRIIELQTKLDKMKREVENLNQVIEAQAATISGLRADLTESEQKRRDLKNELQHERSERMLLSSRLEILKQKTEGRCESQEL